MNSIPLPVLNTGGRSSRTTFTLPVEAPKWNFADPGDGTFYFREEGDSLFLFVADGSRIYRSEGSFAAQLRSIAALPSNEATLALSELGVPSLHRVDDTAPTTMRVRSFSLAVAQKCNLGCTYCYAQEGDFGGVAVSMPLEIALAAVDKLFEDIVPGQERVVLAFMGGEPLLNRDVVQAATLRAVAKGKRNGVPVMFSITTNGTLVTPEDGEFFEQHGFSVTVSLDGDRDTHDQLRPYKGGQGSYERILSNVTPLLERQREMQVAARVTVTPRNLRLPATLDELIDLGFYSVGFSPMLASPTGRDQMGCDELDRMLEQMIDCGREFERHLVAGRAFPFSNMQSALREIHRGTHRPYPCGAGGGYMGVSASGSLFACHRFVDDSEGWMGDLTTGVDPIRQETWLQERHVHRQEPCNTCWARYLCGGGCHHEVIRRGRPACDYIRGWLDYCLGAYARLSKQCPEFFT